jgi:hypothetical protein
MRCTGVVGRTVAVEGTGEDIAAGEPLVLPALGEDDAVEDAAVFTLHRDHSATGLIERGELDAGLEGLGSEIKRQWPGRGISFAIDDEGAFLDPRGAVKGQGKPGDRIARARLEIPTGDGLQDIGGRGSRVCSPLRGEGGGPFRFEFRSHRFDEGGEGRLDFLPSGDDRGKSSRVGAMLVGNGAEELRCSRLFRCGGRPVEGGFEESPDRRRLVGSRVPFANPCREVAGLIDEEGIVQERERLRGDVGDVAASHRRGGGGKIEGGEERIEVVAFHAQVERATRRVTDDRFAEAGRIESSRDREEGITDRLGLEAAEREGGKEAIVRILFPGLRRGTTRLTPRFGEDEFADERLERPLHLVAEPPGEVVEQFGMARFPAEPAEIVGGGDESFAEKMVPDPVDEDAGGEGILFRDEIAGEFETTGSGGLIGCRIDRLEETPWHRCGGLLVIAADEERLVDSGSFPDAGSAGGEGDSGFEGAILRDEFRETGG